MLDPGLIHTQMLRDDYGKNLEPDDPKWLESRKSVDAAIPVAALRRTQLLCWPLRATAVRVPADS